MSGTMKSVLDNILISLKLAHVYFLKNVTACLGRQPDCTDRFYIQESVCSPLAASASAYGDSVLPKSPNVLPFLFDALAQGWTAVAPTRKVAMHKSAHKVGKAGLLCPAMAWPLTSQCSQLWPQPQVCFSQAFID